MSAFMKCREYRADSRRCLKCDIKMSIQCTKIFDFDVPRKYERVERNDHMHTSWIECPTCGTSIGYHPDDSQFRCLKCSQRVAWK